MRATPANHQAHRTQQLCCKASNTLSRAIRVGIVLGRTTTSIGRHMRHPAMAGS